VYLGVPRVLGGALQAAGAGRDDPDVRGQCSGIIRATRRHERGGRRVRLGLFAVGAVSGTVLSYELELLWPKLMGVYGPAFGIPFSAEAVWFFVEAIFTAIYLYGWRRLPAWCVRGGGGRC